MNARRPRAAFVLGVATFALACGKPTPDKHPPPEATARQQGLSSSRSAASLIARGESTYNRAEFDSARAIFDSAYRRAGQTSDTLAQARSLTSHGLAAFR